MFFSRFFSFFFSFLGKKMNDDGDDGDDGKQTNKERKNFSLTLLEQALKLEPAVSVRSKSFHLRDVCRVVRDRAVEEPVGTSERFRGVLRRLHRADGARGGGDSLAERGL